MGIYVIVDNGVVINRVQADSVLEDNWVSSDTAQIGWLYDELTGEFSPPQPESVPVPESVTARQARQWMIENDIMPSQVDAMIAAVEDVTERELLKNYWEYSTEYQRNHHLLISLGEQLNLTPDELDQAFREASKL